MFLLIRLFSVGITCGLNLHLLVLIELIYGTGKFAEGWNLAARPKVLHLTCGLAVSIKTRTCTFVGHRKVENLVP